MLRLKDTLESTVTYALEAGNAAKLGSVAASNYVTTNALSSSTSNIIADNAHRLSAYSNNDIANSFFYRNGTPTSDWTGFPSAQLSNASACTPYIGTAFYNKSVSVLHTGGGSGLRRHDLVFLNNASSSTVDGFLYITNNRNPAYVLDTQNYKSKGNVFGSLTAVNSTVTGNQKINGQIQAASSSCTSGSVVNFIASNSTLTDINSTNLNVNNVTIPATSYDNLVYAGTLEGAASISKTPAQAATYYKGFFGTANLKDLGWQDFISVRHRNNNGDGPYYGMYLRAPLFGGNLIWRQQVGRDSWQNEKTILDSVNYTDYSISLNGGTLTGKLTSSLVTGGTWIAATKNGAFNLNTFTTEQPGSYTQSYISMKTHVGSWALSGLSGQDNLYFIWGSDAHYDAGQNSVAQIYFDGDGNIHASKVYNAVYNDYAELFPRGESTTPGDIIALDMSSNQEKYVKATISSKRIVGVQSDEYAHLIGGEPVPQNCNESFDQYNLKKYIPVGLVGRCRVKVIGPVSKGDDIIPTDIPGVGRAWDESTDSDRLLRKSVGFAVESSTDPSIKLIRVKLTD